MKIKKNESLEGVKQISAKVKNCRSREEKTKGITLIALIVTIIVLLILAGITIQIVMQGRNNGKRIKGRNANKNSGSRG